MSIKKKLHSTANSSNISQTGLNNKIGKIENITQIIGAEPDKIENYLKDLKGDTKQKRLLEVMKWRELEKITFEEKELLERIIKYVDENLQTSKQEIERLRAEGENDLAAVLEKLNQAFEEADIEKMLAIGNEESKKLKINAAEIDKDIADKLVAVLRYDEAKRYYIQTLELQKNAGMTESPVYATSLNNLAGLYCDQGKYKQAEPLYQQALEIRKEVFGINHPSYAISLNNLALLYHDQGRYEEAEPLYKEALKIDKNILGKEHPDYATDLNNLAVLYRAQGKYEQAELLYREVLRISREVLGKDHPATKTTHENLNLLLREFQQEK